MIYDALEVFKKEYEKKGLKLILDKYVLKDGLYLKINKNESLEYFIFKNDKNESKKENCLKDLENNIQGNMYDWFKERDYYSGYLNSNKAFLDKKIHNVNYLSLFIKLESFVSADSKKLNEAIAKQYKNLCSYQKFVKPKEKEILSSDKFIELLSNRERKKDIIKKYRSIRNNIKDVISIAQDNEVTNYIKIFFDENIEKYQKEIEPYYAIKIFNDIKYCKNVDGIVFGLSDSK